MKGLGQSQRNQYPTKSLAAKVIGQSACALPSIKLVFRALTYRYAGA